MTKEVSIATIPWEMNFLQLICLGGRLERRHQLAETWKQNENRYPEAPCHCSSRRSHPCLTAGHTSKPLRICMHQAALCATAHFAAAYACLYATRNCSSRADSHCSGLPGKGLGPPGRCSLISVSKLCSSAGNSKRLQRSTTV